MTNESVYSDLIKEVMERDGDILLNPEWVLEALKQIEDANAKKVQINPEWLRAETEIWFVGTPRPKQVWMYRKV